MSNSRCAAARLPCHFQWFSIPFAMSHEAFTTLALSENDWIGSVESHWAGVWFDYAMLLICGGIPWQVRAGKDVALRPDCHRELCRCSGVE